MVVFEEPLKLSFRQHTEWKLLKCSYLELNYKERTEANATQFCLNTV